MTWQTVMLGDVCKVIAGQSPESKNYNKDGEGLAFYQGKKDFGSMFINPPTVWTSEVTKEAIKDDILMSVRAPVGPVNIATEKICIGRGLAAIRATDKINQSYLFKYLLKIESELVGSAGAVFNSINKTQIENLKIPLPPLPIQKRIVSKLDAIFAEIDIATEAAEANVKNADALFQSYLTDVFEKGGEDWLSDAIGNLCLELFAGGDVPKERMSKLKTSLFSIPIFTNGEKDKGLYGFTDKPRVTSPSVTISARGTIGYSEVRYEKFYPAIRLIVATPNTEIIKLDYLKYAIKSLKFINSGASIPQLTVPMIKNYQIKLPKSKDKQIEIVNMLDKLNLETMSLRNSALSKITQLSNLRNSILQQAFNGELVKD